MAHFRVVKLPLVCNALGDKTIIQSDNHVNGYLWEVMYVPGTIDTNADITLTVVQSALVKTILTLTNAGTAALILYPRASGCGATGTVASDQKQLIPVVGQFQVLVDEGGDTGTGNIYMTVLEG
jgi:hypothetical protein